MARPASVEEYMANLPEKARTALEQVRSTIGSVLPDAQEGISYQIPAFKVNGRAVIWYAAYSDHYSLYPATDGLRKQLGDELKRHFSGRGTLRFAYSEPVPTELISKIVAIRLAEEVGRPG